MAAIRSSSFSKPLANANELPDVPWERVERFVGQLTHDVRNGLNAVELQLTFLGEISTDPEAVEEIKRLRNTLGNVTRHLQTMRNATASATPYPLEYPTGEFFDDLRERFAKLHPGVDGKFIWEVETGADTLLVVDPELTLNALLELLANALHFTQGDTPPIRVLVTKTDSQTVFLLQQPQLTEPTIKPAQWGRAPLLSTRRGAYGLGLFRVRRCLETQGGTLEAEYSSEQNILTIQVTLPGVPPKQS